MARTLPVSHANNRRSSEAQAHCELCGTRRTRARDHAKISPAQRKSRDIEDRVIQQVVELGSNIQPPSLRHGESLLQGGVRGDYRRSAKAGPRRVSEGEWCGI